MSIYSSTYSFMSKKDPKIRKLGVTGKTRSYFLTLPKDVVKDLEWRKGQKVTVERDGKKLIVKDWKE